MAEGIYLDVDVVLKMCTFRLPDELVNTATLKGVPPAILGVASFTLRSRVKRSRTICDRASAQTCLEKILSVLQLVEPLTEEVELAAELEELALEFDLEFDAGESQLFAMLIKRNSPLLLTGDKRAIRAVAQIVPRQVKKRVACLEQVILEIISRVGHDHFRKNVCTEREADRAVTMRFACSSDAVTMEDVKEGLLSYISNVREYADDVLIPSDDLSAVVS
jgi:hypothetical protein